MLDKEGPQFPDVYNMSDFSIEAYAKGNWLMVIDFELEQRSVVLLTIIIGRSCEPFYYHLNGDTLARIKKRSRFQLDSGGEIKAGDLFDPRLSAGVGRRSRSICVCSVSAPTQSGRLA